jgi:hypothetical protein
LKTLASFLRQWRNEFGTQPPTRLTIARIRDKFKIDGTVGDVHKERSGRPRTATTPATSTAVLQQFIRSPQKSVKQCSREIQGHLSYQFCFCINTVVTIIE